MRLLRLLRYPFLITIVAMLHGFATAQELNCNVQVSAQQIQGSNRQVFENMQRDIYEFMNSTVWTNHVFSYAERIDCNILINLTEQISADEFSGTIQIQVRRPVYNTTYSATMLNFIDNNFRFRYVEFQPLEFDATTHRSNLVSVLAYYTYIILGFDYDSFSLFGGTEFFRMAEKIVTNAQNAPKLAGNLMMVRETETDTGLSRTYLIKNMKKCVSLYISIISTDLTGWNQESRKQGQVLWRALGLCRWFIEEDRIHSCIWFRLFLTPGPMSS